MIYTSLGPYETTNDIEQRDCFINSLNGRLDEEWSKNTE